MSLQTVLAFFFSLSLFLLTLETLQGSVERPKNLQISFAQSLIFISHILALEHSNDVCQKHYSDREGEREREGERKRAREREVLEND